MTMRVLYSQGGIIYSNAVTTVSPTYAREALEGGAAGWLRSTLAKPEVSGKFKVTSYCCHMSLSFSFVQSILYWLPRVVRCCQDMPVLLQ